MTRGLYIQLGYSENKEIVEKWWISRDFDLIDCIIVCLFMYLIQFVDLNFSVDYVCMYVCMSECDYSCQQE